MVILCHIIHARPLQYGSTGMCVCVCVCVCVSVCRGEDEWLYSVT